MPRTKGTELVDYIGDTPEKINMCLNCSRPRCVNCLDKGSRRMGVTPPINREDFHWSPPKVLPSNFLKAGQYAQEIYDNYCKGMSVSQTAEIIGKCVSYVTHMRKRMGLHALSKQTREMLALLYSEGVDTIHEEF